MFGVLLFLGVSLCVSPSYAEAPRVRQEAVLITDYHGSHPTEFTAQLDRVRLLTKQAQLEVSSRLGLFQYQEGFQFPLTIRLADSAPSGLESALAFVRLGQSPAGFVQELVVNLDEITRHPMDFDTVFYHEMTHAVMNDAVGGTASERIPPWVQEGLAIYVSGEGDARVKAAAQHFKKSQAYALVVPLDGPYSGWAYPQYYLAIKYMLDKASVNSVQSLVRNLIGGMSIPDALHDSLDQDMPAFQKNVAVYSLKVVQEEALPDY